MAWLGLHDGRRVGGIKEPFYFLSVLKFACKNQHFPKVDPTMEEVGLSGTQETVVVV